MLESEDIIPDVFIMACLRTNSHGDAELFKKLHRGKFVYCKSMDKWLRWAGHHWEIDHIGDADAAVEDVADAYEKCALGKKKNLASAPKEEARAITALVNKLERRAEQLRGLARRTACLKFVHTSKDPLAIEGGELDSNPWLLACSNCVIELKTGRTRPGRPDDYLLKASPVEWQGFDAPVDAWIKSATQIMAGDSDMVEFLQRLFGMAIIGKVTEKVFPVFTGPGGDNGKTTIIEGVAHALGPMAGPIPSEMLLASYQRTGSGPSPDIMTLRGLRVAYASETEDGAKVSAARVKWLTGKDSLTGRWPNDKFPITFDPTHNLFLMSNFKPRADSEDKAFWSRMLNIPFVMRFVKNREPKNNKELPADTRMDDFLREQAPGILAWLVDGCLKFQQIGLAIPEKVRSESESYQKGLDDIGSFIEEFCFRGDEDLEVGSSEFYAFYEKWYQKYVNKNPRYTPTPKTVGMYLTARFDKQKTVGVIKYFGISINYEAVAVFDPDAAQSGYV